MNQPRIDFPHKLVALEALPGDRMLGRILSKAGKLSSVDIERILKVQHDENIRFGEAARKLGLVTDADIELALMQQFEFPCIGADDVSFGAELRAAFHPFSTEVETLRAVRSQLVLRWFAQNRKHLAIVGATGESGCSYVAANLAVLFSQLGERTLLIDADLRRPRQHEIFRLSNRAGLSDILAGKADLQSLVQVPQFAKLSVLPAGTIPPNPQELLGRPLLRRLLSDVAESFDVILLDAPPCLNSADALAVAAGAGGALIVVRKDRSSLKETRAVIAQMAAAGAQVIGSVLNEF